MDIDIQNLETLLAEGKYDDARKIITEKISAPITDGEKGDNLIGLSTAYLDISNAINTRYRDALKEAVEGMKVLRSAESKNGETIQIAEVREKLDNL
jgi:hypothetical protein